MPDHSPEGTARAPRRWTRRRVVVAVAAATLVVLVALRVGPAEHTSSAFFADAPAVAMPTEQLAPVTLAQFEGILVGLRGVPVVVNIWASWCAPCRAEMPLLERAAKEYDGRAIILGVDSRDAVGPAEEFLDDVGVTYPNVFDRTGEIRRALDLRGFPTTYFFDEDGELVSTVVGGVTEARLAAQLAALT